jgi:hypothetical protein
VAQRHTGTLFVIVALTTQIRPDEWPDFFDHSGRPNRRALTMTTLQAFLLGMMVAWTPSLVLLGWFLLLEDRQKGVNEEPA